MVQYLRNKRHSTSSRSPSSSSSTTPNSSMSDIETGPEVLIEDPMTQRLLLAVGAVDESHEIDIQVPPPAYTIKDEHLEFENNPPPPTFADAVPSTSSPPCSHPPKARKLSRASSSGSQSGHSYRRWSRHHLFRYHPSSVDSSNSNNNNNNNNNNNSNNDHVSSDHAADTLSRSTSGVDRSAIEPSVIRIPNVARWVAESRRDAYRHYASSPSSEPYSFGFVSTYSDSDTYHFNLHQDLQQHRSSTGGTMRILPSMGVLYPSVIVHM
ncbi:hypothetical protein BGZ95_000934 [Linnemannia exigua]|uniref:Uncharacterized protein n=1 Tax=Linnemannia exigua TaxID=604196 RepID=A0AAD4D7J5_9FUNG|nr:hypothetical protein BGZ95_000934 [Linnemannia exigua]